MIVDAGPLVANVDVREVQHDACVDLLETHPGPLVVPHLVVTEVAYIISSRRGPVPEVRFLADLAAGHLIVEPVVPADWERIAQLVWAYRDLPLGTVDASVVATAERLGISEVATLDHRHFATVRPNHVDTFTLLP